MRERIIKGWIQSTNDKYKRHVVLLIDKNGNRNIYKVHRLVANAFLDNKNNLPVVNHKDFNPLNNDVTNLEWVTQTENISYSRNHGRLVRTPRGKIEKLVDLYKSGESVGHAASIVEISRSCAKELLKKEGINPEKRAFNKYHIDLDDLLSDLRSGMKNKELAEKYNCSIDIIATRKYRFKKRGLL